MKHHQTLRRGLGVLLALVMCLSLLPATALADDTPTPSATADFTTAPDEALAMLNAAKTGTEDSEWDSETSTLTLNGVNFTTTAATAVKLPEGATIVLAEGTTNTITSTYNGGPDSSCGIYATNGLTIEGTGTLTVTGGTVTGRYGYYSYGIYTNAGDITIKGGTVTAKGGKATGPYDFSCGIYANSNTVISGGTVTATGGEAIADNSYSYGIFAYDTLTISGGTVTATGGTAEFSFGIYAKDTLTISGSTVTATGGTAEYHSYGIFANSNTVISGGRVEAASGAVKSETSNSFGIYAKDTVTISGEKTEVTAKGGTGYEDSKPQNNNGICAYDTLTISGGTVTATGGEANNNSNGICAYDTLTISGGTVTATGGEANNYSNGIYANASVTISGGHVIAQALATTGKNYALNKAPDLSDYTSYYWRTSKEDSFTSSTDGDGYKYNYENPHTYVEFSSQSTVTTYTVTVQNDGNGSATATPTTAAAGTEITLTATANSGYHFKGWQVISGTVTIADNKFTMPDSNVTVKAIFEADAPSTTTYTITFDANGGSGEMSDVTNVSGDYTLPTCTFTAPSGKQFKGWATSATGAVISGTSITVNENTTLYAIWKDAEHSMPGYHAILTEGFEGAALPAGWSMEDKDGDGWNWEIEESEYNYYKSHHGRGLAYSASYVNNVGELKPDNWLYMPEITIGSGYKLTFCLIAQDDTVEDDLLGVYISTDGGKNYTQIGADYAAKKDWAEHTVDLSAYVGEEAIIAFVHHNCTDKFWLNLDCVYIWAPDDSAETYTVRFDANGGMLTGWSETETEADGTVDYLSAATRDGYTFDGWYTEATGGEKVYTYITKFTADTTVYAHWTLETQTKQITEASFTMDGYTVGANPEDIVITSYTDGLSLIGGYFEALGQPYSYLLGTDENGDGEVDTLVTGALKAGKEYILALKVDVNAGYDVSGLAESAVTLNSTIPAEECGENLGEATFGITFVLPVLTEGDTAPAKNTVTVNGSYASATGAGEYEAGDLVTLAAGSRSGYTFSGWSVVGGGVILADANSASTTFIMPANDVTVTANWTQESTGGETGDGSSGGGSGSGNTDNGSTGGSGSSNTDNGSTGGSLPSDKPDSDNPQTGDTAMPMVMGSVAILALAALVVLFVMKRRQSREG